VTDFQILDNYAHSRWNLKLASLKILLTPQQALDASRQAWFEDKALFR
jgi:hypothetical protein